MSEINNYLNFSPEQYRVLGKKIAAANDQDLKARYDALQRIDNVLLQKGFTTAVARRFFREGGPGDDAGTNYMRTLVVDNLICRRPVNEDDPVVKYSVVGPINESRFGAMPAAVSLRDGGVLAARTAGIAEYEESFTRVETHPSEHLKSYIERRSQELIGLFETIDFKAAFDYEDHLKFSMDNYLLSIAPKRLASVNISAELKSSFTAASFVSLRERHKAKLVPASRLLISGEMLSVLETTPHVEISNIQERALSGDTSYKTDGVFQLKPLAMETKKYTYYSFDKYNASNLHEAEQDCIKLDDIKAYNVAGFYALDAADRSAAAKVVADYMVQIGYKFTELTDVAATAKYGSGWEFAKYLDVKNFYPAIPITGDQYKEAVDAYKDPIISLLGKKFERITINPPRAYWGHMDFFEQDMRLITRVLRQNEKNESMEFRVVADMILTASNPYAVTVTDLWEASPVVVD